MNKIKSILLLLLTFTLYMVAALKGAVGCMDNSMHLRQGFDTKAYHYVSCDCPCRSKARGTNRCAKCGHIMVPQSEEYITQVDGQKAKNEEFNSFMRDPAQKIKQMIQDFKNSSNE